MIDYIKANGAKINRFYDVLELIPAEGLASFSDNVRNDKDIKVIIINKDYCCTDNMESFVEYYGTKVK